MNNDGQFNVADVIALQNWLLSKPEAVLRNWNAGELTGDNSIDIFDLAIMRRMLLQI